ncbi:uncharacterized protein [Montipora capricornis]|uniref:uncharacterized protein n=1 Tax=Montipora capricornis TaxID=246305 RepID=UPI0035F1E53A
MKRAEVTSKFPKRAILQNAHALDVSDSSHILKGPYGFFKQQKYCDVTLKISEERKIRAHRVVLASVSHYFDSLFGDQFMEAKKDEVELLGFDGSAMTTLVDFAYSGNICIHAENVLALLEAANYLGVEFVQKSCAEFLTWCIEDRSCLMILDKADIFALEHLRKAAKQHALRHFSNASKDDGFLNLPYHLLKELLESEEVCGVVEDLLPCEVEREKIVLQAVLKYVEHDPTSRVKCLRELLSLIRLPTQTITSYLQEMASQKLLGDLCDSALDRTQFIKCKDKSSDAKSWVITRKFPKSVVISGRPLGYHGHGEFIPIGLPRKIADDESRYVKGMKLWVQYEGDRTTIRGLEVFYNQDPRKVMVGRKIGQTQEFHLQENEKIVKAEVRMRWRGIDQITFYTNKQDARGNAIAYGPYGESTSGLYVESPPGSYGYLTRVSACCADLSLQLAWRTFVFPGDVELPHASYEVNDRVLARSADNLYYPGAVTSMNEENVHVLFDDENTIICNARDISAVIPDKVPDPAVLKRNSHVIVSCQSRGYRIGYVDFREHNSDGYILVNYDEFGHDWFPSDRLRLFPEHTIPHEVGARVFARWPDGVYYRGFITRASDWDVIISGDDGGTITLNKRDRTGVILDVLPQATEILVNELVIGRFCTEFLPGQVISIDPANQMFDVRFDDGHDANFEVVCSVSLCQIRLIPRE